MLIKIKRQNEKEKNNSMFYYKEVLEKLGAEINILTKSWDCWATEQPTLTNIIIRTSNLEIFKKFIEIINLPVQLSLSDDFTDLTVTVLNN